MRQRSNAGFTLVEAMLAATMVGSLLLILAHSYTFAIDRSVTSTTNTKSLIEGMSTLEEIQTAIRMSDTIDRAGDGVLSVTTRYFIDSDSETETVRYSRSGTSITREVAQGIGSFALPETVLENVSHFSSWHLRIEDSFETADYGPLALPITLALPILPDTASQATRLLRDLGSVDLELPLIYDSTDELLRLTPILLPTTFTVSPPLPKSGLHARVRFDPVGSNGEYRPLVYGNEARDSSNVSLVFRPGGAIELRAYEGGTALGTRTALLSWSAGREYEVQLIFDDTVARGLVRDVTDDTRWELIGSVPTGSIDNTRMHIQAVTNGKVGTWDDLLIHYPFVPVDIDLNLQTRTESLRGGATSRQ